MQKILISEINEQNPIKIGDYIKIISYPEYQKQGIKFNDKELQKRISNSTLIVMGIGKDNDIFFYKCEDLIGNEKPIKIVDSDIEYIVRIENKCNS